MVMVSLLLLLFPGFHFLEVLHHRDAKMVRALVSVALMISLLLLFTSWPAIASGVELDFRAPGQVYAVNSTGLTSARQQFDRVVVMFYAPWCSACQRLKPKYAEAAALLRGEPEVRYLSVDATEEMGLALQFDIQYANKPFAVGTSCEVELTRD